jgi:flavin reductase (DIM6/NTAB) family NADH-FMN oxidoreductase RutF
MFIALLDMRINNPEGVVCIHNGYPGKTFPRPTCFPSKKSMLLTHDDVMTWERVPRLTLLNALSGYKSAVLVGTAKQHGHTNLAIFNQVVHIGANPPYLALVMRPTTVPRHTYDNIKETGFWTINHVHPEFVQAAHQTSASYPDTVSEFEACGFTPEYRPGIAAPFVAESRVRLGLAYEEEYLIKASGVLLIVGKVLELHLPDDAVAADGFINLESLGLVATGGLDAYYEGSMLVRLPFARV